MLLLIAILLIGVLLGYGLGGSLRAVAEARVGWWWLVPAALLLQALPVPRGQTGVGSLLPVAALLTSYVLLILVVLMNWRLRGFMLVLVGLILNFTVIGMNHGMPVSAEAVSRAGKPELIENLPRERGAKHHLADERDVLLPLADVVAFRPPFGVVTSVGDLAIYAGGAMFLAAAMLGRSERGSRRARSHPQPAPQAVMWGTRR